MKRKINFFILTAMLLFNIICLTSHAKAADDLAVNDMLVITNEEISSKQSIQQVDEIVDKLLNAINENDYEKFSQFFELNKNCTINNEKISEEAFVNMREEIMQKGGHITSRKLVTNSESGKLVRNEYIATCEKDSYIAKIVIKACELKDDSCVVTFYIKWYDANNINAINIITDQMLTAINKNDYTSFSKYFTDDLKMKYSKEEFRDLHKNINSELGNFQKKENKNFNQKNNNLSVTSNLFYDKSPKTIEFTIDTEFTDENIKVKKIFFQWVPKRTLAETDELAEKALVAICNENNYEKFTSYYKQSLKAQFTEDIYNFSRKSSFDNCGNYLSKKYVGVKFIEFYNLQDHQFKESTVFIYKLCFENNEERYLKISVEKEDEQLKIEWFMIDMPMKYIGKLSDKQMQWLQSTFDNLIKNKLG